MPSGFDELMVGANLPVGGEDEKFEADPGYFAACAHHLPVEFDDIAQARSVLPRAKRELAGRDKLFVGARNPGFEFCPAACLEGCLDGECGRGIPRRLRRLQQVLRCFASGSFQTSTYRSTSSRTFAIALP